MKKRTTAALLALLIVFSTFSSDLVSKAEETTDSSVEIQQEQEQTQLETPVENQEEEPSTATEIVEESETQDSATEEPTEESGDQIIGATTTIIDVSDFQSEDNLDENLLTESKVESSETESETTEITVLSVEMYMNNQKLDGSNSDAIEITSGTEFKAVYTFPNLILNTSDEGSLQVGTAYTVKPSITGIKQFNLTDIITADVKDDNGTVYGVITVTPSGDEATMTFTPSSVDVGTLSNLKFEISFKLDTTSNTSSSREGIVFPDGKT